MTLEELLSLASKGYLPEDPRYFQEIYDFETGQPRPYHPALGDSLAYFIVVEIAETFDPNTDSDTQLEEAIRVMERAREEIDGVIRSLLTGGAE